ncbi:MAG: S41 family peptidase [Candidatus Eisenbacteria bacterium]
MRYKRNRWKRSNGAGPDPLPSGPPPRAARSARVFRRARGVAFLGFLLIAGLALPPAGLAQQAGAPLPDPETESLKSAVVKLIEVVQWLHYSYVDSLAPEFLLEAAVEGICQRLDPQTALLSDTEWERMIESTSSGYVGIGVGLDFSEDLPLVRVVQRGSPAEEAGILPGDRLVRAEGQELRGLDQTLVSALIRGPGGSSVRLEIVGPERATSPRRVRVDRRKIEVPAVESARIHSGRIGYVRLERFGVGTSAELQEVLEAWDGEPLGGLVFDLRGNPGGLFDEAAAAAALFLNRGKEIVRTESRLIEERERICATLPPLVAGLPLVVLVDSLTASSAEVFAGALQGAGIAMLAGEATYGKRTIQRFKPLEGGGALRLTTSRFATPADARIPLDETHPVGAGGIVRVRLQPDLVLSTPPAGPWLAACDSAGLIDRFLRRETFPEQTRDGSSGPGLSSEWSLWSGPYPSDWRDFATSAPGFAVWVESLIETLSDWGMPPKGERLDAENDLRRLWLQDWAAERWGDSYSLALSAETDPWIIEALRRCPQTTGPGISHSALTAP